MSDAIGKVLHKNVVISGSTLYTDTPYEHAQVTRGATRVTNRQDVISRIHKVGQTMTSAFTMSLVGISVNNDLYWL